jgi:uncharacterized protein YndB with AHSA1/START domain
MKPTPPVSLRAFITRPFFSICLALVLPATLAQAQGDQPLVHEAIVNAPPDQVWSAFTSKAGLESWMVAHAEVDLKLGGHLKTQYDPNGTTDDASAIANEFLSYEPQRMLSYRVVKAPATFPFPDAIKKMWTVVYFEPQGDKATRVRVVCLGFTDDEQSQKMRAFFNRGNAITLEHLQKRFAPKTEPR